MVERALARGSQVKAIILPGFAGKIGMKEMDEKAPNYQGLEEN